MAKVIAIGDVHGRDTWKKILEQERSYDVVVFMGDYFDSFDLDANTQLKNFREILKLKRNKLNQTILLVGNHEMHYLLKDERYTGYQPKAAGRIKTTLTGAMNKMAFAFKYEDMLFTHAGITKTWAKAHNIDPKHPTSINSLKLEEFAFVREKGADGSGNNVFQSPLWVRPASLKKDMLDGYTQIVGHTEVPHITPVEEKFIMIDSPDEYLVITDESCVVKKVIYGETD